MVDEKESCVVERSGPEIQVVEGSRGAAAVSV